MTKENLRDLVKSHFSLIDAPVKETFAQAELLDGTVIKTDAEGGFEVGQKAMVVTEEGDAPAPMGEHELTDGTILVINEEGEITGVKTKDEEGQGSLEGDTATEMEEMPEEVVEMAEEEIAEEIVEAAIEEGITPDDVIEAVKTVIEEVVQPQIEELKKEVMAYKEKMEKISNEPATESKTATTKFAKTTLNNNEGPAHNRSRYEMALQTLINKRKK